MFLFEPTRDQLTLELTDPDKYKLDDNTLDKYVELLKPIYNQFKKPEKTPEAWKQP